MFTIIYLGHVPGFMDLAHGDKGCQTTNIKCYSQITQQFVITPNPVLFLAACVYGPDRFDMEARC